MEDVIVKPWGHEKIIEKNSTYVVKQIYIESGKRLSLQYHERKIEHMTLVSGKAILAFKNKGDSMEKWSGGQMKIFQPYYIPPNTIHRLMAPDDSNAIIVEISTTELDDIIRLADDHGRL